jgi:AcrR family transcriptional regulator
MNDPAPVTRAEPVVHTKRPRGRPTIEEGVEIDDMLISTALRTFVECGYGGASMRNIAKAANVSRTTLLARFSTKGDLFRAIMNQHINRMGAVSYLKSNTPPDLKRGLMAFANRALTYSLEGEFLEVNRLIYSTPHQFPEIGAAAAETTRVGIEQITEFIRQCAQVDQIPCQDPEMAAQTFILLLRGWSGLIMLTNRTVSAAEREAWVEATVRNLIEGRKGW